MPQCAFSAVTGNAKTVYDFGFWRVDCHVAQSFWAVGWVSNLPSNMSDLEDGGKTCNAAMRAAGFVWAV
ncbi:hypothetical protein NBRC116601_24780 [Cognatishimia sp. WU-CL00825]